jgi:predicted metal-dependent hydrolase
VSDASGRQLVDAMEKRIVKLLDLVSRVTPRRFQLGVTCALEHFTAVVGQTVLEDPRIFEGADETMAALWRWHSAEECEHRSVAFDVFKAAGGSYPEGALTMFCTSIVFWAKVLEHKAFMIHANETLTSAREWADLGEHLFVTPGGMFRLVPRYFAYYRPSFHPDQESVEPLLERFRASITKTKIAA